MSIVPVNLAGRSYKVKIGHGLLAQAADHCEPFLRAHTVPIVADAAARAHWGEVLEASLEQAGKTVHWYDVEGGEASKSWASLEKLTDWLLAREVSRGDHVLALGGGVVGDLTGFACAILKRGCGFVQLPTTLLSQVDSSVGGKTAINTSAGKNLIGAFHQPSLVLADLDTLDTLPQREMHAGFAEVLKYGILGDAAFFSWLEDHGAAVIVMRDETEQGDRALLNLGHTFGHALEAETGFSAELLHGEAVALGMVLAARYSVRRGELAEGKAARIADTIAKAGLRSEIAQLNLTCDGAALTQHMAHDKKMQQGNLPFLLLKDIGEAYLAQDVALPDVAAFLEGELGRQAG
jgi:3-dehydroquinate synthase